MIYEAKGADRLVVSASAYACDDGSASGHVKCLGSLVVGCSAGEICAARRRLAAKVFDNRLVRADTNSLRPGVSGAPPTSEETPARMD